MMEGEPSPEGAVDYACAPTHELPAARALAVEYPGFVENVDACLSTLSAGGQSSLQEALQDSSTRGLELRHRPADPMCHPVYGDSRKTSNLLLRVRRRKRRPAAAATEESGGDSADTVALEASVVAVLDRTIRFDAMSDFQYLGDTSKYQSAGRTQDSGANDDLAAGQQLIQQLLRGGNGGQAAAVDAGGSGGGEGEEPLHLAPPIFSKVDVPRDYAYRPNPCARSMQRMQAEARSHVRGGGGGAAAAAAAGDLLVGPGSENSVGRRWGKTATLAASLRNVAVDYLQGDEILRQPPVGVVIPSEDARLQLVAPSLARSLSQPAGAPRPTSTAFVFSLRPSAHAASRAVITQCQSAPLSVMPFQVSSLFQERPIWSRLALVTRLRQIGGADIGVSALKRFLPAVAFYFLNGPWRSVGAALTTTASGQPRTPRYS
eukprot:COSAG01_NODE_1378_length_10526_cov_13.789105_4_plen_433_part_00